MVHHSSCVLLLLLLTCQAGVSVSDAEQGGAMEDSTYGPSSVEISGVDVITVGIPYGFECWANCFPECHFTWSRDNVTTQGPELTLQLHNLVPAQTLTCTVVNPTTGRSVTVQKTLQVTEGPSNIQINGPPMLTFGATSVFTCSADCYPSCSYSWTIVLEDQTFGTAQGDTISVTPPASTVSSETLLCQAEDTVSHLYISTALNLWVASQSDISIQGANTVTLGKQYTFVCLAACIPSCDFTWLYMGKTFQGNQVQLPIMHQGLKLKFASHIEITVSDYSQTELLTCEATNTVSHVAITATINLTVIDPFSVHPTSQAAPVAGNSFSLECVGAQNPASIIWLGNKQPVAASERVHFSPGNVTMTFSPLLQTDDGSYLCAVAEGGAPIQSVPYKLTVNYGPTHVVISGPNSLEIGVTATFLCSAECFPSCSFTWTLYDKTTTGSSIDITVNGHVSREFISCQAENTVTGTKAAVNETLSVSDPRWCGC